MSMNDEEISKEAYMQAMRTWLEYSGASADDYLFLLIIALGIAGMKPAEMLYDLRDNTEKHDAAFSVAACAPVEQLQQIKLVLDECMAVDELGNPRFSTAEEAIAHIKARMQWVEGGAA